ncbi:MAG TPA: hypothetical protein VGB77_13195 [Abditibacteriaceae bacterium]|jgi:N-acetylglucosamine-6-phosphate deacetylase
MFFDLQVNGYAGVDFNSEDVSAEQLHHVCAALKSAGVIGFLATIVTEHLPLMTQRLQNLVRLREADPLAKALIRGFHIEGPFLSPVDGYRGAHPQDAIRPANRDEMQGLLDAAGGLTKLVTLAPECDENLTVTKFLSGQNIRVAAGHTDASLDQLREAMDNGLTLFTHLGNGCPMLLPRHDNIVQRALSLEQLKFTFIADGAHIPFFALKNYLTAAGMERCAIVTDAIAPASLGPGNYSLGRWQLTIGEDMVARAPDGSHLVGAAITMPQSAQNLREQLGFSEAEVKQLTWENPRAFVGI